MGDDVETIPFPASLAQYATCTAPSTQETWILTRNLPLLPFWGLRALLHDERHDEGMLRLHIDLYHPLALRWLKYLCDYFFQ